MSYEYPGASQYGDRPPGSWAYGSSGQYDGWQVSNPASPSFDSNIVLAVLAIVIAFVSCWGILTVPLGIISIVKANQAKSLWRQGQGSLAQSAAADAKKFAVWGLGATAAILAIVLAVQGLMFLFMIVGA